MILLYKRKSKECQLFIHVDSRERKPVQCSIHLFKEWDVWVGIMSQCHVVGETQKVGWNVREEKQPVFEMKPKLVPAPKDGHFFSYTFCQRILVVECTVLELPGCLLLFRTFSAICSLLFTKVDNRGNSLLMWLSRQIKGL